MAAIPIYDRSGKQVGEYQLDPKELAPHVNKQLLHDAVVMYERNQRQGSVKTKARSEVAGTTKKMYRQKGTGNARAGSRRSGIRRGGGHIHHRQPRDWSYRLPRKALQLATRMALAAKVRDGQVALIDSLSLASPKTKEVAGLLKAIGCQGASVHMAIEKHDENVYKSARNIERLTIAPVAALNAYAVLRPKRLVMTTAALDAFRQKVAM